MPTALERARDAKDGVSSEVAIGSDRRTGDNADGRASPVAPPGSPRESILNAAQHEIFPDDPDEDVGSPRPDPDPLGQNMTASEKGFAAALSALSRGDSQGVMEALAYEKAAVAASVDRHHQETR